MVVQRFIVQSIFAVHFLGTAAGESNNIRSWICTLGSASIHRYVKSILHLQNSTTACILIKVREYQR